MLKRTNLMFWITTLSLISQVLFVALSVKAIADTENRLQPSDLIYQGAFRLPDEFNWGARGMSYFPLGSNGTGTLLITTSEALRNPAGESCYEGLGNCSAYFAEVAIPKPSNEANWQDLPVATFIREPTAFDNGLVATVHEAHAFVTGIQYVPGQGSQSDDKIYGSLTEWYPEGDYGQDSFPTVWFSNLDGSDARGMFHVGPTSNPLYHGRKMGEYLFTVPQRYADTYLGGRVLLTGRSRGTPASMEEITTSGGSQGPTLFAFKPWQSDSPIGDLDAIPVLYYRVKYPGCAGPDIGVGGQAVDCDYPGFSMCDSWNGGSFVENGIKNAILILGHKGSTNCYYCGDPDDDSECHVTPLPGECELFCQESRGYHCGPYKRQVIFYDTVQLGKAALGQVSPWEVKPYVIWEPEEFYLDLIEGNTCGSVGGMAFDSDSRRLFMIERGLGGYANENAAVVHVWYVAASGNGGDGNSTQSEVPISIFQLLLNQDS